MNSSVWIQFSIFASFLSTAKVLLVKTTCQDIRSELIVFYSRFVPALFLLLVLPFIHYEINDIPTFLLFTLITSTITICASILYVNSLQKGYLCLVVPVQASIPFFMMICTYFLFKEVPSLKSCFFIVIIVCGIAYLLIKTSNSKTNTNKKRMWMPLLHSVLAAALFGISTVFDRIAISATTNGALAYSAYWHVMTSIILMPVLFFQKQFRFVNKTDLKKMNFYVLATLCAFVFQQLAVQYSLDVENGVTFVKSIVMTHITFASGIGILLLKEKMSVDFFLASLVTFIGGFGLLMTI